MKEYVGIPYFADVEKKSYLDMYFSIIETIDDDFDKDKELINWDVNDIKYRFYLDGLRRAVLTELLDTLGNVSKDIVNDNVVTDENENASKFYNLLHHLQDKWTPELKYSHEHY